MQGGSPESILQPLQRNIEALRKSHLKIGADSGDLETNWNTTGYQHATATPGPERIAVAQILARLVSHDMS